MTTPTPTPDHDAPDRTARTSRASDARSPKLANIRETERTLRAARRVRRQAYAELCAQRKALREQGETLSDDTIAAMAFAARLAELPFTNEVRTALGAELDELNLQRNARRHRSNTRKDKS
jgi:hypothetical protein